MIRENIPASHASWGRSAARRPLVSGTWMRRTLPLFALGVVLLLLLPACLALVPLAARAASSQPLISAGDWTTITPTSAPLLKQKWAHSATNGISDQAVTMNGVVY